MKITNQYIKLAPAPQNAVDLFAGEWASKLPDESGPLRAGQVDLFADSRIQWAAEQFDGVAGKRVLELGPLEAGHTFMLERMGAAEVLAVESNARAYVKCLIVKELFNLKKCQFLLGDFVPYLKSLPSRYDLCVASGVLYHMKDPVELISLLAKASDSLFIWTHYFDERLLAAQRWSLRKRFSGACDATYEGFRHKLYKHSYGTSLKLAGFCGGNETYSHWMTSQDILAALKYFGFSRIAIDFHEPDHPNGPAFCLACRK